MYGRLGSSLGRSISLLKDNHANYYVVVLENWQSDIKYLYICVLIVGEKKHNIIWIKQDNEQKRKYMNA